MASNAEKALAVFQKHLGEEEGVGAWHTVDQAQINAFADATLDHQFIHIDPEKAAKLSPYKVTIAHGFLTLSLVVHLGASISPIFSAYRLSTSDENVLRTDPRTRLWESELPSKNRSILLNVVGARRPRRWCRILLKVP